MARYKDVDAIWSLAWSPDGRFLASGTFGSTVRFFDTQNLETQRSDKLNVADTLSGLSGPVRSIAWSPDGRILALGMANQEGKPIQGDVILWDVNNRKILVHPLPENNQPVRTVTFDPAGKTLAIGRDDGSIVLWDVSSQQILGIPFIAHQHRVMSIAFSPDGRYLISGGYEGTIAVWNLQAPTKAIAVSPKGDLLATSQGAAISLWDLASDRSTPVKILSGHTDDVLALAFSPDGNTLVSSGKDNIINYWDAYLTQLRKSVPTKSNVPTLQFSPDGSTLALAGENGRVQLYDPVTGDLRTLIEYDKPVIKLQFGEGGKTLQAATKDGNLLTWDLTSFESQTTALPEAQGGITSIALSNDGQKAAFFQKGVTPDAGRAHGLEISFWDNSFDPTVNPDDIDFIVVQATNGLRKDRKFDEFLTPIQSVPMRGAYHFFQLDQPWKEQADLFLSVVKDKGFHFFVLDLEVNPKDGSTTFLSDAEQWLKYVDQQTDGRVLLQVGSYYLTSFGADGDWMKEWPLSIMQYPFEPNRDGTPFLPQGFSEWKIWQYTDKGNNAEFGIGAPGSSTYLALYNGTPQEMSDWLEIKPFSIYDRPSSGLIHPNQAIQVSSLNGIAFSPDGSYLAVTGDGNVLLLNAETGEEISTLSIRGRNILSLSFLSDSNTLTIGTDDGTVILWDLSLLKSSTETKRMLEIACSQVQQNFTKPEWLQYFGADTPYNATCPNALVP